ncbi:hypothetical protein H4R33_004141 [Dimargaris cristalligena]|uniref:Small nuclear ribonucleoprotein G n=1 Tax=Dimargaris cristalligena TaxID=215637 RepID=A0A4P9ZXB0_9FUNG|nr:hypothetical protein H4R33_004141 [Dimargaris cristalligena]RKP38304.1 small nuclear ribonucleo protein G-like protein [Dimargaris cristalligena]|eukprot:RKP38304.1 small nuclear ribonucleo protein G-like protein [Dimargaris cristalligena]
MSSKAGPAVSKATIPELKDYMEKRLLVQLNGRRRVTGILRGYDPFMNIVLDDATEEISSDRKDIGMIVIRGNSIEVLEAQEKI